MCKLVDSLWSFFRCYLVLQFVRETTEGAAREEIWPSVNYLFFISTSLMYRKNPKVRQSIVKDLKSVLQSKMSRVWGCLV